MSKTVVGVFDTQDHAEVAARRIKEQGLRTDDISIVAKRSDSGDPYDAGSAGGMGDTGGSDTGWVLGTGSTVSGGGGIGTGTTAIGGRNGIDVDKAGRTGMNDNISDGVISGGLLGGLAGLLIGAGSMIIPGLGIIAAAGPITGLLSGAVTGGIVGGLIDLGIPERESKQYESDIRQGKVLFSMRTDDDKVPRVEEILRNSGASNVQAY
jgi:hypothetical protein